MLGGTVRRLSVKHLYGTRNGRSSSSALFLKRGVRTTISTHPSVGNRKSESTPSYGLFSENTFINVKIEQKRSGAHFFSTEAPSLQPFQKATEIFPGSMTNIELIEKISLTLEEQAGFQKEKTLVATSLCCDEVNRPLEVDLADVFTSNFNMGGLAGFPFGGATSFGAMAAHIPDGGSCLVVYGPHVGVDSTGAVGTVERRGRAHGGSCCGSAVAASNYVSDVRSGGVSEASIPEDALDAQQYFVGKMLLPYAEALENAGDKMVQLPHSLYEAQSEMMERIVKASAAGVSDGSIALLGGIQINTPPGFTDYFLPMRFDLYDNKGEMIKKLW